MWFKQRFLKWNDPDPVKQILNLALKVHFHVVNIFHNPL